MISGAGPASQAGAGGAGAPPPRRQHLQQQPQQQAAEEVEVLCCRAPWFRWITMDAATNVMGGDYHVRWGWVGTTMSGGDYYVRWWCYSRFFVGVNPDHWAHM